MRLANLGVLDWTGQHMETAGVQMIYAYKYVMKRQFRHHTAHVMESRP